MKILGIDTSTKFLCLGIYDGSKLYEYNLEVGRRLSSSLNVTIKRVLVALGWSIKDIDYFACGLGPGSFTGVRIGLAAIKGLSWSLRKPLVGISTLDTLAEEVKETDTYIVPAVDAKRNLIYCSIYKIKEGILERIMPYMLLTINDFFRKIKNIKHKTLNIKQIAVLGDALNLYKEQILRNIKGVTILDKDDWYPKAHNLMSLAKMRIRAKKFDNPFALKPIYLYPKECQIRDV